LLVGGSLTVNLNYIAGAPFFWQLEPFNTQVLQMVNNYNIPPSLPGGTGIEVWVFQAIQTGSSPIVLEYQGLSGNVVDTFTVTVNVATIAQGVGGEVEPVNKAGVLTPWILLVSILGIAGAISIVRRRKTG